MKKLYICFGVTLFIFSGLFARDWSDIQQILANDATSGDKFGHSVSIDGDYAVIGSIGDDDNTGAAYIFQRNSTTWIEQVKLTASDATPGDKFGCCVSMDEDYVAIGSNGAAYIFQRIGSTWTEQIKLIASAVTFEDMFGSPVSISGDYVAIGSVGDDDNTGAAYIFHKDGSNWVEQTKITASDGAVGDLFGASVSLDGDYVVIGAPFDDINEACTGSAYIFHRSGTMWEEQTKLTFFDIDDASGPFAQSVSISEDYVVCGAIFDEGGCFLSGSAYIFQRNGTIWIEQAKIFASDSTILNFFGCEVFIDGNYVVIGAIGLEEFQAGSAYIYFRNGNTWIEQTKVTPADGEADDEFGCSASLSGDYVMIGSHNKDYYTGATYVYYNDGVSIKEENVNIPVNTLLHGNYPNPFNPTTTISFSVAQTLSFVKLEIFNIKGQKVKTFTSFPNGGLGTRSVVWNGVDEFGKSVGSGIYFYKLKAGDYQKARKMILLK